MLSDGEFPKFEEIAGENAVSLILGPDPDNKCKLRRNETVMLHLCLFDSSNQGVETADGKHISVEHSGYMAIIGLNGKTVTVSRGTFVPLLITEAMNPISKMEGGLWAT